MEEETKRMIEETVLEILRDADMMTTTEFKVRSMAAEKLGIDLSRPDRKLFVRGIVESFLISQHNDNGGAAASDRQPQQEQEEEVAVEKPEPDRDEEEEEEEGAKKKRRGPKEYDDGGDLIICRLSNRRRVTLQDFRGRTLVSIREYYMKDGKELPSSKGISLTVEQWGAFRDSVPAIEAAIEKLGGSV